MFSWDSQVVSRRVTLAHKQLEVFGMLTASVLLRNYLITPVSFNNVYILLRNSN